MHLTILGSGTNVHPTRAAAGYLVQTDQTLLLDFGPRTLGNLMKLGVNRHALRYILFSHFHADHFADFIHFFFDAVFYSKFVGKRPDLTIIGPRGTKKLFGLMLKNFPGFNAGAFRVTIREVADRSFRIGRANITARTVEHSQRLHCLGYRIEYGKKVLAYSGDAMYCDGLLRLCHGADVAVLDCSFPANRPGPNHLHAGDCGRVAREASVKRLVLSHFYPITERFDVKKQAGRLFKGRITMGRDLMRVVL
ncbi:MAG: MBL fold metallo-hydrolase [Nitrospira sp.]|nr:MBL fold metallo-hydrolase [Nitrospira sp.]